jgi:DNA-binding beta-propeller fold protein YncE
MTKTSRHQRLRKLALIATSAATISLAACSTSAPTNPGPTTASSAPTTAAQASDCAVNPSSAPMPTAEEYRPVPADARISVALNGIPSGTVKPGDPPTEVDVTLCNNSPVDYPKVGVVLVLTQCSCATYPSGLPIGTGERFDAATNSWVKLHHPVITTGADYLGAFTDVLPLPKGKTVTLRYRVALDASMLDGKGAVQATAVVPDPLVLIGRAELPFVASKETPAPPIGPRPTLLPFTGLTYPSGVAVNSAGDIFVTDSLNDRVLKLAAGSSKQTVLPFTGLQHPGAVAVDAAGNVYVNDGPSNRVLKLAAGATDQTVLPFTGLENTNGLAVDGDGNVYVSDFADGNARVVKLAAGSNEQTVLPFTGISSARNMAVDSAGSVYVNDGVNNRVVKLTAGATDQTVLPLTGLKYPDGLAVDTAGDVYVIDHQNGQVMKFAAGSSTPTALPSAPLYSPAAVAVDGAGNVYVIDDSGFGRVVKLGAN